MHPHLPHLERPYPKGSSHPKPDFRAISSDAGPSLGRSTIAGPTIARSTIAWPTIIRQSTARQSTPRAFSLPRAALCLSMMAGALMLLATKPALAQSGPGCDGSAEFPCGFQLQTVELQPVPRTIKFQARVSQAKLPIGEGLFNRVVVNLKRGDETLCREEFRDVIVSSSVVNLELGRNMSCELDQVVAENPELLFQLCIGGPDNCLRPVSFGTAPYAMKSSFAQQSQFAHQADVAGQANYSHRTTADRDMFRSKTLGKGYFDFHTPGEAPELYPEAAFNTYRNGGFIQWTPMQEAEPTLHISARSPVSDLPVPLARLVLAATATDTTGRLNVRSGGVHVTGPSEITGNTVVRGQLKVERVSSTGPQGIHAEGDSSITGKLGVSDSLTVSSGGAEVEGGLQVKGDSSFSDSVNVHEVVVEGRLRVNGVMEVPGEVELGGVASDFSVGRDFVTGRDAMIMGDIMVQGEVVSQQGLSFATSASSGNTKALARVGSTLVINPGESHNRTEVDGDLEVRGTARFNSLDVADASGSGLVPQGAILMWSGSLTDIPPGWALCDGSNNTPDLRDRFILGHSADADGRVHETDGSHSRNLTVANLPPHTHGGTTDTDAHSHGGETDYSSVPQFVPRPLTIYPIGNTVTVWGAINQDLGVGPHRHTFVTSENVHSHTFTTDSTGGGEAFDNRPAFYRLAFIMKL